MLADAGQHVLQRPAVGAVGVHVVRSDERRTRAAGEGGEAVDAPCVVAAVKVLPGKVTCILKILSQFIEFIYKSVSGIVRQQGEGKEIVARIFVCPNPDAEQVRAMARFAVNTYLNVPVYAAFHEWLGREDVLQGMWSRWREGDRKGAAAAIPDEVVDDLIVHGPPEKCREHIQRYVENGVDTPVIGLLPLGVDPRQAARDLAPA